MQTHDSWRDRAGHDRHPELLPEGPLVEQKSGEDFCISQRTWFDAYGGLSAVDPDEVLLALEAGEVSALGEVVGTPMVGFSAIDVPDEALDAELEMALAAATSEMVEQRVASPSPRSESLYDVTEIRKRIDLVTDTAPAPVPARAPAVAVSAPARVEETVPPPAVLAGPADLEQVE
jgi:hypothetical protein